jgi:hypothetical protein
MTSFIYFNNLSYLTTVLHKYKILIRKLKRKRPLGRPRHRWEDNIRMDLQETGWEGVE